VHPQLMAQQGAACRSSAPGITFVPPRANRSGFGPAYPVSKLLKFFKLFDQRPNTEPESKGTIISLDTVTQHALLNYENQLQGRTKKVMP
jgi:hypothetical protein